MREIIVAEPAQIGIICMYLRPGTRDEFADDVAIQVRRVSESLWPICGEKMGPILRRDKQVPCTRASGFRVEEYQAQRQ